jgi:hypothetical protein
MKRFITNALDVYSLITSESPTHYICGNTLYSKNDILEDYHPLDTLTGVLHLHVVPFYNY